MPWLFWAGTLAVGLQWIAFVPAAIARTERFYDLVGSATYLSVVGATVAVAAPQTWAQWLPVALVSLWALRLGSFLVWRVHKAGTDARFDAMKQHPASFSMAWSLQGLWVAWTALAALVQIATPSAITLATWVGLVLWVAGFAVEVVADRQKSNFKDDSRNAGRFIDSGLWAWSRHPNYFGEIVLWTGIAVMGLGTYAGGQWVALGSPVFVVLLLTRISGVPPLERRARERWGDDPAWRAYRARTPALVPRPPRA